VLGESSPEYKGPILFNPGGPGGSGVEWIRLSGDSFTSILGPQFDLVGFDPRGVGQSTPRVAPFRTAAEQALWYAPELHIAEDNVANIWARALVHGQLVQDRDDGYLRHINTDQTARDMLRIVEAHGRTKLQYWGVSYGSVLGAVFASMFPDNIERLLIDGIVDSENYFATLWSNNLLDADKAMETFYTECADAGPDGCAFWAPSPNDIRQNLTILYNSISVQPVPVKTGNKYGYVDHRMLHGWIFTALYSPFATYRLLAQSLAELATGNGTIVFDLSTPSPFDCSGELPQNIEAQTAILCNDGASVPSDLQSTQKHFEMMSNTSEFGNLLASIRTRCAGWPKFPKNHFHGPFEANTSHPILLIGNTADPITPLWAANKMSRGFSDSIVLTQNSSGHCSISAPSLCTAKYVRQYFVEGTLPKEGTICQSDSRPFNSSAKNEFEPADAQGRLLYMEDNTMSEEDKLLLSAMQELSSSSSSSLLTTTTIFSLPFGNLRFGL
jgi:pimeloyl-ACP methyl ester carboxylesterase